MFAPSRFATRRRPVIASAVAAVLAAVSARGAIMQQQQYVFGCIAVGETFEHVFSVTNGGPEVISVLSASSSCSCLTIAAKPDRIAASGYGDLKVVFKAERVGSYDARIALETDDPMVPVWVLRVRGRVLADRKGVEGRLRQAEAAVAALGSVEISPADAQGLLRADGRALMVDIRPWGAFSACRISGSRNYPAATLSARRHLSDRPVILVGSGWDRADVEGTAAGLIGAGFADVRVLCGGLAGWIRTGMPVVGSAGARDAALTAASAPLTVSGPGASGSSVDRGAANSLVAGVRPTKRIVSRASDSVVGAGGGIVRRAGGCGGCP